MRQNCQYYHECQLPCSKCNSKCVKFKKANWGGVKKKGNKK